MLQSILRLEVAEGLSHEVTDAGCPEQAQKQKLSEDFQKHQPLLWLFSVWAFCCHTWALHELHNIPSLWKNMFKMI